MNPLGQRGRNEYVLLLFFYSVHLLACATVQGVRGRVHAFHLVEDNTLVCEGLVLVLELVVPALLLHDLFERNAGQDVNFPHDNGIGRNARRAHEAKRCTESTNIESVRQDARKHTHTHIHMRTKRTMTKYTQTSGQT